MKLRNKKTGKIIEYSIGLNEWSEIEQEWYLYGNYETIDELKEEWEDYKPAEPLIKDEKIRKAVRAWAEALKVDVIRFERFSQGFSFGDGNVYSSINFDGCVFKLEDGKEYTITELCGVEEE